MMRLAFVSDPLVPTGAPVAGSIRITEPERPIGSLVVRMSCARRRPPSDVGRVSAAPTPPGGSPHGFAGDPD